MNTYESFYNLCADPFRLSPDYRFSFAHSSYRKARAYMQFALDRAEGLLVVTGAPGTGKTTLINELTSNLNDPRITVVPVLTTRGGPDEMLRMVATSLGLSCNHESRCLLRNDIKAEIARQRSLRRRVILLIDEAQDLSTDLLEELRILADMQQDHDLLLQICLFGQEPLIKLLQRPGLEHLRDRVVAAAHLRPLSVKDTALYIIHRLKRVGWQEDPVFTAQTLALIHGYARGVPRLINRICSRLLLLGAVERKRVLDKDDVNTVMEGFQEEMLFGEWSSMPEVTNEREERAVREILAQIHSAGLTTVESAPGECTVLNPYRHARATAERSVSVMPVAGNSGGNDGVPGNRDRITTPALLKDISGYTGKEFYPIASRTTTISRRAGTSDMAEGTIIIGNNIVGRNHALIYYRDYCYWIIDLGSVNGTYVNNERISNHRMLESGDIVRFARYEFEFINSNDRALSA